MPPKTPKPSRVWDYIAAGYCKPSVFIPMDAMTRARELAAEAGKPLGRYLGEVIVAAIGKKPGKKGRAA